MYLVHSYIYYQLDDNIITDAQYDEICKKILKHWDDIKHPHKVYINKESLVAGSGFDIKFFNLPNIVVTVAHTLHNGEDISGNKIDLDDWF